MSCSTTITGISTPGNSSAVTQLADTPTFTAEGHALNILLLLPGQSLLYQVTDRIRSHDQIPLSAQTDMNAYRHAKPHQQAPRSEPRGVEMSIVVRHVF